MAKFLNTSATTYVLEQLINKAKSKVVLVSPYLKLNKRIKQIIEDRANEGIEFYFVYGKQELKSTEKDWLLTIDKVNLFYCDDLHAKCYLNESYCIITSMNLYEFSQVNNNEMGILLTIKSDPDAFTDAAKECQRLIRISEAQGEEVAVEEPVSKGSTDTQDKYTKITTSALAKQNKTKTQKLVDALKSSGYIFEDKGMDKLTDKGKELGAEYRKGRGGYYFLWPSDLNLNDALSG